MRLSPCPLGEGQFASAPSIHLIPSISSSYPSSARIPLIRWEPRPWCGTVVFTPPAHVKPPNEAVPPIEARPHSVESICQRTVRVKRPANSHKTFIPGECRENAVPENCNFQAKHYFGSNTGTDKRGKTINRTSNIITNRKREDYNDLRYRID